MGTIVDDEAYVIRICRLTLDVERTARAIELLSLVHTSDAHIERAKAEAQQAYQRLSEDLATNVAPRTTVR